MFVAATNHTETDPPFLPPTRHPFESEQRTQFSEGIAPFLKIHSKVRDIINKKLEDY